MFSARTYPCLGHLPPLATSFAGRAGGRAGAGHRVCGGPEPQTRNPAPPAAQVDELGLPIKFVGVGEGIRDLQPFDPEAFVDALFPAGMAA